MSITKDRPRTTNSPRLRETYRAHGAPHIGGVRTGSATARTERRGLAEEQTGHGAAQPSVVKVLAGVLATAAILLGLVSIANMRAGEPSAPAPVSTSAVSYDVGVAAVPVDAHR